jgi:hypothetical protein
MSSKDRDERVSLRTYSSHRLTPPDKKHRKPQKLGESVVVSIPHKHILARAREVGMSIADFILNYELEVAELIPKGGSILESYSVFRFVRRRESKD